MKILVRWLRLSLWFVRGIFQKHNRLLISGFVSGFLIFLLVVKLYPLVTSDSTFPREKKIAVIGLYSPTTLPSYIQNIISQGLTSLGDDGEATSSLALNWEIRDDGKTYLFNLKNNVYWHDGAQFKASDINYNLRDVKFEAITNNLLKISLKEPFSPLPTILSRPLFKKGLIGVGPYKVNKLNLKGDNLVSISLIPINKDLPPLQYIFYPNEEAAITAYMLGEVNMVDQLTSINGLSSQPNTKISSRIYYNYNIVLFYNTQLPILSKRSIRQGLAYALPALDETISSSPLNPFSWAYNDNVKVYETNHDLAKSILSKEGLSTTSAHLTISTFSSFIPLAQKISNAWKSYGITTDVKIVNTLPNDYDVLLISQEIPPDPDQYHLWHSTQTTNISNFNSPKIDKLLEDGRKIIDKVKRMQIYKDFQRYLVEEAPAIFLYHPKLYTIERK
ncbi:MAG: ABC transporter substrate-binding protein [Candidatus Gottesmanbacteria bacterium]